MTIYDGLVKLIEFAIKYGDNDDIVTLQTVLAKGGAKRI